jgi:Flp pilus assembly protein TadG
VARRQRSERGAVAVEAALVTPLLMLLVFGIIEMSFLMRDAVGVTNQVRSGARIASTEASAGMTTTSPKVPALATDAVTAIANAGSSMPLSQTSFVLVYQANSAGYPLPAGNTAMTCTTNCVKYVYNSGTNRLLYSSGSWDSSTINACVNDGSRMSVGVAMSAQHTWITGLFGTGVAVPGRVMMQFEPLPTTTCTAGSHP